MKFTYDGNFHIEKDEVIQIFSCALKRLVKEDKFLLEADAQERSLVFKLALYLRELLQFAENGGLNIDVEYNRDGKKAIKRPNPNNENDNNNWIAPDIILHERGSAKNNYKNDILYCEIKKKSKSGKRDAKKIKEQMEHRKYKYGINLYSLNRNNISLDLYLNYNSEPIRYKFDSGTKELKEYPIIKLALHTPDMTF